MAAIDSAYSYYLSTYASMASSRYDTHKKSQLRAVYNNIVKTNKDSPLYKIKNSGEGKRFAIDIKEHTRSIQNVVAALSDTDGSGENAFYRKIAESSDEESVSAEYIGTDQNVDDSLHFDIKVMQLASPQVNLGSFLSQNKSDIKPGIYSFDLNTEFNSYEFQYSVGDRDTNRDVQNKMIRLINSAGIGLKAELMQNREEETAIRIESKQTGLGDNEQYLFEILPAPDSDSIKAMKVLGINQVAQMAQNSAFLLNGTEHSSLSNTFTVNNDFELTLRNPSKQDTAARIGFKTNVDAAADNVQSLVNVYNNMVQLSYDYSETQESNKLLRDMINITRPYHNELESIGLQVKSDGKIDVDRNLLADAVTAPDAKDCFSLLNEFKEDLGKTAASASIDPMNYVSKVLIAYKNPVHNFATPYITSIYSGMMLDRFC